MLQPRAEFSFPGARACQACRDSKVGIFADCVVQPGLFKNQCTNVGLFHPVRALTDLIQCHYAQRGTSGNGQLCSAASRFVETIQGPFESIQPRLTLADPRTEDGTVEWGLKEGESPCTGPAQRRAGVDQAVAEPKKSKQAQRADDTPTKKRTAPVEAQPGSHKKKDARADPRGAAEIHADIGNVYIRLARINRELAALQEELSETFEEMEE